MECRVVQDQQEVRMKKLEGSDCERSINQVGEVILT